MADGVVLGIPQNVVGEPQDMSHLSPVYMSAQNLNMLAAQQNQQNQAHGQNSGALASNNGGNQLAASANDARAKQKDENAAAQHQAA